MLFENGTINRPRIPIWLNLSSSPCDRREITITSAILIGTGVAAAAGLGAAAMSASAQEKASEANIEYQERANAQNVAYAREEQARLEKEEAEATAKEEARLAPWYEAQKSALEKYTEMAENPEISDLTRIRLEEEEKAINKELASKGLLFSGPAAELRQKARERIIAEETESAKTMLTNVMSAQAPASGIYPGTAQYNSMIASLTPKVTAPTTTANTAMAQGVSGVGASILGGAQSYLTYQGSKDISADTLKQRGSGLYSYPLSIYDGASGVGLY